jgi:hypothetical protein
MANLKSIIDEVQGLARGYTRIMEQATHLNSAITTTSWTENVLGSAKFQVHDITQMARGICEIEDELIYIDAIDQDASILSIAPYGRGYNSTTPATHAINSRIILNPIFPRAQVKEAINATILSLRGSLYGLRTVDFPFVAAISGYQLPYDTYRVFRAEWQIVGPSKIYSRIKGWRYNPNAHTDTFPSGKNIELYDVITPGRTVHVLTSTELQPLNNNSDDFEDTTNLGLSCKDMIVYGSVARLLAAVDMSRLDSYTMEANTLDSKSMQNSAMRSSQYMYSLFEKRKLEEVQRLLAITPVATHHTT